MAKDQLKEQIQKILFKSNYVFESPSYRAVIDDDYDGYDDPNSLVSKPELYKKSSELHEADPLPNDETGGDIGNLEADILGGGDPNAAPADPNAAPAGDMPPADPNAAPDAGAEGLPDEIGADPNAAPAGDMPPADPQMGGEMTTPSPDELQNDIIKKNIEVMKQLNQKIENLEMGINQLNMQNQEMTMQHKEMAKEVEEVREPTNVEKLMSRKQDSHPFYYGLNDMWKGNWFQGRRDELGEKGMKQLEDGSYVADFDQLPQYTTQEIKDSFNKF